MYDIEHNPQGKKKMLREALVVACIDAAMLGAAYGFSKYWDHNHKSEPVTATKIAVPPKSVSVQGTGNPALQRDSQRHSFQ